MVRRAIYFVVITLLVAAIVGPACAKVASKYEVVEIDSSDLYSCYVSGINNAGVVYGSGYHGVGDAYGAFRRDMNTGVTQFTDQMCIARDMNADGATVGCYTAKNGDIQYCVWNADGSTTDLPLLNQASVMNVHINDAGRVLGERWIEPSHVRTSIVWTAEHGIKAPSFPSTSDLWNITDFNNAGFYLGHTNLDWYMPGPDGGPVTTPEPEFVDAIWSEDGTYYEIERPSSSPWGSSWEFINDLNQVAGNTQVGEMDHVMRWDPVGGLVDVTAGMNGFFGCYGLNNAGQMLIGGSLRDGSEFGHRVSYIWDPKDGFVSIQDLIDPASRLELGSFKGFNDNGWILADAYNLATHRDVSVVLRPVTTPEPSGVIAVLVGFVGLVRRKGNSRKV